MKIDQVSAFRIQFSINETLRNQGISIDSLSKKTGVDRTQIWRFQKGRFKTYSKNLAIVCKFLSIEVEDFVGGKDQISLLMETLHDVWDGSEEHACKITSLLRSTAPLLEK
ncbi:helix-turn-helix domain-containing protein [Kangiella shandongensis]|uniref:helix-turn-helix domain-containing protein n=1 Tax=Kangiella shandongensis TaxID=2763258 RepID=UPI001CBC3D0D|nr:helix-turn-helix domain-containing protein [Kangiella shandongensis]